MCVNNLPRIILNSGETTIRTVSNPVRKSSILTTRLPIETYTVTKPISYSIHVITRCDRAIHVWNPLPTAVRCDLLNKPNSARVQGMGEGGFYCLLVVLIWLRFCDCGVMMVMVNLIKIIRSLLFITFKRY